MTEQETLRNTILEATLLVFRKKGLKFTMDDIASQLSMSKKTIYTVFRDKNTLIFDMVDYCFDSIKESEKRVLENTTLSTAEKIRKILGVMPEGYENLDLRQLYLLKDKYPLVYKKVEERLETGWEATIGLLEQGMAEGSVKQIKIPILKTMMEASLEQFFQRDILMANQISYEEALEEVVSILTDGILTK